MTFVSVNIFITTIIVAQIAYHGAPERAYEVFVQALRTSYNTKGFVLPQLEDHNPAGNKVNFATLHYV